MNYREPIGSRLVILAARVAALKSEDGKYLLAIGSTGLVQSLITHDLVDEFRLMIDPVVLGVGKRLFRDDGVLRRFRLTFSEATTTGAILATYTLEKSESGNA